MTHPPSPPPSEFRVPTVRLDAKVYCADGVRIAGCLFLPAAAARHSGPTRPEERLNDDQEFFPFLLEGGRPVVLNKAKVVVMSFDLAQAAALREAWEKPGSGVPGPRLRLECCGECIQGEIVMDTPQYQQRLLDRLNHADRFLCVVDGDRLHLVSREHIVRACEVDPPAPKPRRRAARPAKTRKRR